MKKSTLFIALVSFLSVSGLTSCGNSGVKIEICNDESNAIRAFQLLKTKGVLKNIPVNEDGTKLTLNGETKYKEGNTTVTLIEENLLVSSMNDYDFACLPCNTAYTGNVSLTPLAKEDDPEQVSNKANVLAARKVQYNNDESYKAKIDVLTEALLSEQVKNYFNKTFNGAMTCDESSQIDLREKTSLKASSTEDKVIKVCASELPHAKVLNECVKDIVKDKGYTLEVKVLDWSIQNDGVANKDYDANYFQHVPYLSTYNGTGEKELFATCKVHYEPLGIYAPKGAKELPKAQ